MNIVLIGYSGSGKTSVSKLVAKKLHKKQVEMDTLVLKKSKRKSINEIFKKDGETRFREFEIAVAHDLSKVDNCVISSGGGVVVNKIIIDYLKEKGLIIYLRASFSVARLRLANTTNRPLQVELKNARKIYFFRKPLYRMYSDANVRTDKKSVAEVANEVIDIYQEEKKNGRK